MGDFNELIFCADELDKNGGFMHCTGGIEVLSLTLHSRGLTLPDRVKKRLDREFM